MPLVCQVAENISTISLYHHLCYFSNIIQLQNIDWIFQNPNNLSSMPVSNLEKNFWKKKKLSEMSSEEWEALCDGCGKCCLLKLEEIDTGKIEFTNVACRLLCENTCRCKNYSSRRDIVKDCIKITPENLSDLSWMPSTCAYKLVEKGRPLPWWHHLVSNDFRTVHESNQSVRGRTIPENDEIDLENHIVSWPK